MAPRPILTRLLLTVVAATVGLGVLVAPAGENATHIGGLGTELKRSKQVVALQIGVVVLQVS